MFNTFNMGVGMALTVAPEDADKALAILQARTASPAPTALGDHRGEGDGRGTVV